MNQDATLAAKPAPPVILGRYRVTGRIASGSVGSVLAAVDERTGAPVAIKCFDGGYDNYAAWLDEMRLIMRLRHPNIVAVLDVGHDDGWDLDVLVFARAMGGSLRRALVQGPRLEREQISALMRAVATALAHAHAHGVIHRDIKPENILALTSGPRPAWAVTDFGAGRSLASANEFLQGSFAGSPGYYAPELLHGRVGPALDQYSLGVVGVELLLGRRPDHNDCLEFALAHQGAPGLEGLIARMISVDLTRRLPSMEAVARALADDRAAIDVTHDDQGRRFSLVGNELRCYASGQEPKRGVVPRALRFCSLRGQPTLIAGERRIVSFTTRPRTEYVTDSPFETLAASRERGIAWIRRGAQLTRLEFSGLDEQHCELPSAALSLLDSGPDTRPIGVIVSDSVAIIGVTGQARVLWCSTLRDRLRVTCFDTRSPLFDGFLCERGPVLLCGGSTDTVLLEPTVDGLRELDRRKANVASALVDNSEASPRLLLDALSEREGVSAPGARA